MAWPKVPMQCAAALDAWCNRNCGLANEHSPLRALYDRSEASEFFACEVHYDSNQLYAKL